VALFSRVVFLLLETVGGYAGGGCGSGGGRRCGGGSGCVRRRRVIPAIVRFSVGVDVVVVRTRRSERGPHRAAILSTLRDILLQVLSRPIVVVVAGAAAPAVARTGKAL